MTDSKLITAIRHWEASPLAVFKIATRIGHLPTGIRIGIRAAETQTTIRFGTLDGSAAEAKATEGAIQRVPMVLAMLQALLLIKAEAGMQIHLPLDMPLQAHREETIRATSVATDKARISAGMGI
jgi:hypothetical protein